MKKSSKFFFAIAGSITFITIAAVGYGVVSLWYRPDFSLLRRKVKVNIKLADRRKAVRWFGPETQSWVSLSQISKNLISAVISSEDGSFWSHDGIDLYEIKEALKKDIEEKRWVRGASTITQQLVKNVYLSQEKTLRRKIREILWARELEKALSKREILNFYLNLVEWGPVIYGVRDAAWYYFKKKPIELTAKESAFLAMLLPSPWRYHEYFLKRRLTPWAEQRIKKILSVMNQRGELSDDEYQIAINERLFPTEEVIATVMKPPPLSHEATNHQSGSSKEQLSFEDVEVAEPQGFSQDPIEDAEDPDLESK